MTDQRFPSGPISLPGRIDLRLLNKPAGEGSRGALERRMAGSGVYGR